jgi:hypothetical protein
MNSQYLIILSPGLNVDPVNLSSEKGFNEIAEILA